MSRCRGLNERHCCWFDVVCPFVEEHTIPGRRWTCGLLRRLGSWDAVHASDDWQTVVKPLWDSVGLPDGYGCGDWPQYEIAGGRVPDKSWACCWADPST